MASRGMLYYLIRAGRETWVAASLAGLAGLLDRALAPEPFPVKLRALELRRLTNDELGELLRLYSNRTDDNHHEP